jgi:signal transduction histidine kinase
MAMLTIIAGPGQGRIIELREAGRLLVLGREGADIDLVDPTLSVRHAEFSFRDGRWFIRDRRSAAGTWRNGERIEVSVPLADGDLIRLGETLLRFESPEGRAIRPDEVEGEPKGPPTVVADAADWRLEPVSPPQGDVGEGLADVGVPPQAGQTAVELSHGIKNILQAIRGGRDVIQTAIQKKRWDKVQQTWPILTRNLDRIEKLVRDLLRFSRQYNPVFVRCDFNGIVRCAVETLRPQAQRERKTLELSLDTAMPPARMDPDQIYDLVLNLVLNALQAVAPNTGRVQVRTCYDAAEKKAGLCVADNGPGIAEPESVFQPFYTTRPRAGLGLGLAIVRKIATQHAGRVDLETAPNAGSTFSVTLPIMADHA